LVHALKRAGETNKQKQALTGPDSALLDVVIAVLRHSAEFACYEEDASGTKAEAMDFIESVLESSTEYSMTGKFCCGMKVRGACTAMRPAIS
jgi:hypothetical protein